MNRSDIVRAVASVTELKEDEVGEVVDVFFDVIGLALRCDENVTLYGFGRFEPRLRRARTAEVPFMDNAQIDLPDRVTVAFIPSPVLKRRMNEGE